MTDKAKSAARALAYAAIAGVFAFFAIFGLLIALIWGIGEFMPIWASALIVTVLFLLLAALVGFIAYRRAQRAVPAFPDEAIETVRTIPEELRDALDTSTSTLGRDRNWDGCMSKTERQRLRREADASRERLVATVGEFSDVAARDPAARRSRRSRGTRRSRVARWPGSPC